MDIAGLLLAYLNMMKMLLELISENANCIMDITYID